MIGRLLFLIIIIALINVAKALTELREVVLIRLSIFGKFYIFIVSPLLLLKY